MKTPRKGSRVVTVNGTDYSWFRGKSNTEIRNLETNKAVIVDNTTIETTVLETTCDCCHEPDGGEVAIAMPANIRHYILANMN